MAATAICLDNNENSVACSDPACAYGDCGSTGPQVTSGSLCLDENENAVACADPNCAHGDCVNANAAIGVAAGASVASSTGSASPATSTLTTPTAGGSTSGTNISALAGTAAQLANAVNNIVSPPPKTSLSLGASGLNLSSAGSLFSNPLMLALLAVIAFLLFWGFKKRS
jgi:hypothetical protein